MISLHALTLILIFMAEMEQLDGVQTTWVSKSGLGNVPNYELYLYGWYWSCTIISTVGFGDITPGSKIID